MQCISFILISTPQTNILFRSSVSYFCIARSRGSSSSVDVSELAISGEGLELATSGEGLALSTISGSVSEKIRYEINYCWISGR